MEQDPFKEYIKETEPEKRDKGRELQALLQLLRQAEGHNPRRRSAQLHKRITQIREEDKHDRGTGQERRRKI